MLRTDATQIITWDPTHTVPRWLGHIGLTANLKYSYAVPGGCKALSCLLQVEPSYRTDALNPGRIVEAWRGSSRVWEGKLLEPTPSQDGWTINAKGAGAYGNDFMAYWTTWNANDAVNRAISRGMRWDNSAGLPEGSSFLIQQEDPAAQSITDHMNLITGAGGYTWYVTTDNYGNHLKMLPIPTTPTRLLVATTPVARTIAEDYNALYMRYQSSGDTASGAASYAVVEVQSDPSIALHQRTEDYTDLSGAGVTSSAAAVAAGVNILNRYQRANFAGPFTVSYGEWLTMGGFPVDIGMETGMQVAQLILTDYGYGGEVTPGVINFLVGEFEFDDAAQTAQVTPFQATADDMSSLISALYPAVSSSASAVVGS